MPYASEIRISENQMPEIYRLLPVLHCLSWDWSPEKLPIKILIRRRPIAWKRYSLQNSWILLLNSVKQFAAEPICFITCWRGGFLLPAMYLQDGGYCQSRGL